MMTSGIFELEPPITNTCDLDEWGTGFVRLRAGEDIWALTCPNGRDWL